MILTQRVARLESHCEGQAAVPESMSAWTARFAAEPANRDSFQAVSEVAMRLAPGLSGERGRPGHAGQIMAGLAVVRRGGGPEGEEASEALVALLQRLAEYQRGNPAFPCDGYGVREASALVEGDRWLSVLPGPTRGPASR